MADHPESTPAGVYGREYYEQRQRKRQLIYRLKRRTAEVERAFRKYLASPPAIVVDVGTADALMLGSLRVSFPSTRFLGLDYSFPLLSAVPVPGVLKCQGDALALPVVSNVAEGVIATAVIEHVSDPGLMLRECARVLRPGGVLAMTTPQPTLEKISSAVGILKDAGHQYTFSLKALKAITSANGFEILEAKKFMFSPVGFPAEETFERIFGPIGLSLLMANQLVIARRH